MVKTISDGTCTYDTGFVCLFTSVDALRLSQQFFSHVQTISYLPGLNKY